MSIANWHPLYRPCMQICENICKLLHEHYSPLADGLNEYELIDRGFYSKIVYREIDGKKLKIFIYHLPEYEFRIGVDDQYIITLNFGHLKPFNNDGIVYSRLCERVDMEKLIDMLNKIKKDAYLGILEG